jgi:predicted Zn finger-like uncharacterized protein
MFTVCPKCALTLVVTAADLRIAQGYVRCGRCSSVFNALPHLTDERPATPVSETETLPPPSQEPLAPSEPSAAEESAAQEESAGPPVPAVDSHEADPAAADDDSASENIPEEALEFNPDKADLAAVFVVPPPDPQWTAATGTFKALLAANQGPVDAREVDSSYLASLVQGEAHGARESADRSAHEAHAGTEDGAAEEPVAEEATANADAARPPPAATAAATQPEAPRSAIAIDAEESADEDAQAGSFLGRVPVQAWRIGVPLALLLLTAQVIHHNREELAASARFNRPLTALYGAFGVRLAPSWDLHAYDVRQLGAEASPAGSGLITVRASIKNAARQAQPLPLLRVTLQDRFGNPIAARDVTPRLYLPHASAAVAFLSAGQRVDAEIGFVDPGANAVGFEIDACLPSGAGGLACANELSAR